MTVHPFPGIASFLRGVFVAAGAVGAVFALLPADYSVAAAVALAFVVTLATAGE
jgi:hypothetical protein